MEYFVSQQQFHFPMPFCSFIGVKNHCLLPNRIIPVSRIAPLMFSPGAIQNRKIIDNQVDKKIADSAKFDTGTPGAWLNWRIFFRP